MPLDLEEQEQLENLKAWWKIFGRWIAIGLVLVLFIYFIYVMYGKYQKNKSLDAAQVYQNLIVAMAQKDLPSAIKLSEDIESRFSGTSYAGMAGLLSANLANATNDTAGALKQLRWVEDNAQSEGMRNIARNRIIMIQLDSEDPAALAEVDNLLKKTPAKGFEPLFLERRGDFYLVQKKDAQALAAYKEAWEASSKAKADFNGIKELDPILKDLERKNPDDAQKLLKVKIDSLGGF